MNQKASDSVTTTPTKNFGLKSESTAILSPGPESEESLGDPISDADPSSRPLAAPNMSSSFYYAVAEGKHPGIFPDWPSCREAVGTEPPRTFKKLSSRSEAVQFIKGHGDPEKVRAFLLSEKLLHSDHRTNLDADALRVDHVKSESGGVEEIGDAFGGLSIVHKVSTTQSGIFASSSISDPISSTSRRPIARQLFSRITAPAVAAQGPWTEWTGPGLITNFPGTPMLVDLLQHEMRSPGLSSVSILCSYVKEKGVDALDHSFADFEARGIPVRLVTTTQLGVTDARAVHRLSQRQNLSIRIFFSSRPSFHAKAWVFNRADGASVTVVGSSNLSWSTLHTGQEWNTRLQRDPTTCPPLDCDDP